VTIIRHDFSRDKKAEGQIEEKKKIPGFQLRIDLCYSSPQVWRTVNVPGTLSLAGLHAVIQHCFGWPDEATHRFLVGKIFYGPDESSATGGSRSSASTQLHEVEKDMGFIFSYLYDGGCGWECEITLEQRFPDTREIPHPVLTAAGGACLPAVIEDIHEYQDLLGRLEAAADKREKILAEQGIPVSFDPSDCDMTAINDRLREID